MRPMPFNFIFYCGSFDLYHSGLAGSVLFFVPVNIVKISIVYQLDFFFQLRNIGEKIRRFVLVKFVKICCELDKRLSAQ